MAATHNSENPWDQTLANCVLTGKMCSERKVSGGTGEMLRREQCFNMIKLFFKIAREHQIPATNQQNVHSGYVLSRLVSKIILFQ